MHNKDFQQMTPGQLKTILANNRSSTLSLLHHDYHNVTRSKDTYKQTFWVEIKSQISCNAQSEVDLDNIKTPNRILLCQSYYMYNGTKQAKNDNFQSKF
jgi:hypothetical protein